MANWVKNLRKNNYHHVSQEFNASVLVSVKQKKYTHGYMDSFENVKNYEHVFNTWKTFEIKNRKNWYDLYLKCCVSLSANVFQKFRTESINFFELDPANYLFTPGYSWVSILRFTGVSLKLISDIEKYQFIKCMIRGGIQWFVRIIAKLTTNS